MLGGGAYLTEDGKDAAPEDTNPKCRDSNLVCASKMSRCWLS